MRKNNTTLALVFVTFSIRAVDLRRSWARDGDRIRPDRRMWTNVRELLCPTTWRCSFYADLKHAVFENVEATISNHFDIAVDPLGEFVTCATITLETWSGRIARVEGLIPGVRP